MENEVCKNCGRAIGKLEQAFVHKGHVVCKECSKKSRDEPQETNDAANLDTPKPLAKKPKGSGTTKSTILWLSLAGWTVLFVVLIFAERAFYASEAEKFHPLSDEHWACRAAASLWFFVLVFIWFLGALPLFIAAIVTRKDKKETN